MSLTSLMKEQLQAETRPDRRILRHEDKAKKKEDLFVFNSAQNRFPDDVEELFNKTSNQTPGPGTYARIDGMATLTPYSQWKLRHKSMDKNKMKQT